MSEQRQSLSREPFPLRSASGKPIAGPRFVGGLCAVAEAVFSTTEGPPPGERLTWLKDELEDFLARAGSQTRLILRLALLAITIVAPLLILRLPTLGRLAVHDRVRALARMEDSALSAPVLAVKALLCILYYEHPDAQAEVGFDGECLRS